MNDRIETQKAFTKQIVLIAAIVLAMTVMGAFVGCGQGGSSASDTATMTVNMIVDATDNDAGILCDGDITLKEEASVYDALIESGLELDVSSMSGSVYIDGIGGVVASKVSPTSGWLYEVNGNSPSVGADSYVLQDGDKIVWTFYKDAMSKAVE